MASGVKLINAGSAPACGLVDGTVRAVKIIDGHDASPLFKRAQSADRMWLLGGVNGLWVLKVCHIQPDRPTLGVVFVRFAEVVGPSQLPQISAAMAFVTASKALSSALSACREDHEIDVMGY